MEKIEIKSALHNYTVEFTRNFGKDLRELEDVRAYIIDKNVYNLYPKSFEMLNPDSIYLVDAIESEKNIERVMDIIAFWRLLGINKAFKVVCVGGGITQEIVGFASSIYLRGIEWYFFPTTLLAMCDSCIGGKSSLNLDGKKNQLGVFYPPYRVIIDLGFLGTLSREDYANGIGELLKYSLISGASFSQGDIGAAIRMGLTIKKQIVEQDEFERGLRRILNFGHTFGHALEAYTNNAVAHGKAIIWGMDVANHIAFRLGILQESVYLKIKDLITPMRISVEPWQIIKIIESDKKTKGDAVHLVLLKDIGKSVIHPIKIDNGLTMLLEDYLAF